jgi:hypothetical protein
MLKKSEIDYIKSNLHYKKDLDYYSDRLLYIFPIAFIALGILVMIESSKLGKVHHVLIGTLLTFFGMLFLLFTHKRLSEVCSFITRKIKTDSFDIEEFYDKLQSTISFKNINLDRNDKVITGFTRWSLLSWGEQITIIQDNNRLLINSRPTGTIQSVTIFKDKLNIAKILKIISPDS